MDQAVSLTELVRRMQQGDRQASNSLFAAAAQRLRSISQSLLSREPATAGFDASDLVQEVYGQKLVALNSSTPINNREHFFSLVAHGMRQILTDRARSKNALKRQAPSASTAPRATPPITTLSPSSKNSKNSIPWPTKSSVSKTTTASPGKKFSPPPASPPSALAPNTITPSIGSVSN